MTIAGLKAIQTADLVCYDRLAPTSLLSQCRQDAELVDVGKVPRGDFTPQETINDLLVTAALAGKTVVRLKGGDSFVFGRGGEEWLACAQAGVPVRVIPGVSSCVAGPELAGIPVTHRGLSQGFTVVSGHVPPQDQRSHLDWSALAQTHTTLVIMMGVKYLPDIAQVLCESGMDPATPAAIVENAASKNMRVVYGELCTIAQQSQLHCIKPPAITIIGEVAQADLLNSSNQSIT